MKALDGKKTYIGIALFVAAYLITRFTPVEVSKDELQAVYDQSEGVYRIAKDSIWPELLALWGTVQAIIGRKVAKVQA